MLCQIAPATLEVAELAELLFGGKLDRALSLLGEHQDGKHTDAAHLAHVPVRVRWCRNALG